MKISNLFIYSITIFKFLYAVFSLLFRYLLYILLAPLFCLLYLIDKDTAIILSGRLKTVYVDFRFFIISFFCGLVFKLYLYYFKFQITFNIIDDTKQREILGSVLSTFINFEGIIFATSFAVTTFILTLLNDKMDKYENKKNEILELIYDLRITNIFLFTILLMITLLWFFFTTNIYSNCEDISIIVCTCVIWSIMEIYSIIKAVFKIVKIK